MHGKTCIEEWLEEWKARRLRGIAAMEKIVGSLDRDMAFKHVEDVQNGLAKAELFPMSLECLEAIAEALSVSEVSRLRRELMELKQYAAGHHSMEESCRWLHALTIDIPHMIDIALGITRQ